MSQTNAKPKKANPAERFEKIAEYLQLKYSLRYNELRMAPEFYSELYSQFVELDEYHMNSWFIELKGEGFLVSDQILKKVTASNLIPRVNPLRDYFRELPTWDGRDHIRDLADTIEVDAFSEQEEVDVKALWHSLFRTFLISTVATATSRKPGQLCLVLTGAQGKGKSTWLNKLCPENLKANFLFTGGIIPKITEKTTVDILAEKFIVNLDDQLDSYTWREYDGLKSIISSTKLTNRKNYDRNDINRFRRATIVASTNNPNFLVDTHNRRYLVFTTRNIDYEHQVDMDQVYSQTLTLFRRGERCYLNAEEQKELNKMNARYRMPTIEEELILQYFTPGGNEMAGTEWLTTTEIKTKLELYSNIKNLSTKLLGSTFTKYGYTKKSVKRKQSQPLYCWGVISEM